MIRKAIIPAAGFGTRLLPATKSVPKELLTIVDKPVIQYVVEEAVESGITDILIIISEHKLNIQQHFSENERLEKHLTKSNKTNILAELNKLKSLANIEYVFQKEQKGLGDAIYLAKSFCAGEPFAVLLGDAILKSNTDQPITKHLIDNYKKYKSSVIALQTVDRALVHRYGIMKGQKVDASNLYKIEDWIEKPSAENAPSNLAVAARYVFSPAIFECLENLPTGVNNEIQITDAMIRLLEQEDTYGYCIDGVRYDIGNPLDFIKANIALGLQSADYGNDLKAWLSDLNATD